MKFKHVDDWHLAIELMEDCQKKDFWYLLVKLSQKPESPGHHWGSVVNENEGFHAKQDKAYEIYNNFSYIYRKTFSQRFYHVLNKESVIEILDLAKKLTDLDIHLSK
jgi:hypothetical protein